MQIRHDKFQMTMRIKGISISQLAKMTGRCRQTVAGVVNGTADDPRISTVTSIAEALCIPLKSVLGKSRTKRSQNGAHAS